jgi:hypothetical protein
MNVGEGMGKAMVDLLSKWGSEGRYQLHLNSEGAFDLVCKRV